MTNRTIGLRKMHLATVALLSAMLLTVAACDDNDAADNVSDTVEDAGDSVSDAVEDTGDAVEDATD